jgi:uncharacterized RDD family membrane protein YckC
MSTFERSNFADHLHIDTPEQVELQFGVAGIGSRFVAVLLDMLIIVGVFLLELLVLALIASAATASGGNGELDEAGKWFLALWGIFNFLLFWGYFTLFEALWHGQTLGKKVMKIRVLKDSGRQITFFEALARNLVRVVDYLPGFFLVGLITMLCNKRNKRLGDLAAGTIVVHDRVDEQPLIYQSSTTIVAPTTIPLHEPWRQAVPAMFPADAVAKLNGQDLMVMETFFTRMLDLPMETRAAMATRIAGQMAAKMGVTLPEGNPERAMESIVFQLRGSGRREF